MTILGNEQGLVIELRRALSPAQLRETECALCGLPFKVEVVYADITAVLHRSEVCPDCLKFFGRRNPERFPTWLDFELAKRDYPEPIFAMDEEAVALEAEDPDTFYEYWKASFLERPLGHMRQLSPEG